MREQLQASFGHGVRGEAAKGKMAPLVGAARLQYAHVPVRFARDVDDAAAVRGRVDQVEQQVRQEERTYETTPSSVTRVRHEFFSVSFPKAYILDTVLN